MRRPVAGRPSGRPVRFQPILWGVLATFLLGALPLGAAPSPVAELGEGVRAAVGDDGAVLLNLGPAGEDELLLRVDPLLPAPGPLRRTLSQDAPWRGLFREGDPGGHRGFSRLADDDGDGRVDEDRADGRDNDGDGLVDEDFAAVGDRMTVRHQRRGDRVAHLETYHWSYPILEDVLFAAWRSETRAGAPRPEALRLALAQGAWRTLRLDWEAPLAARAESDAHRPIHVTALRHGDAELWIGVTVLAGGDVRRAPRLDDGELVLPLDGALDAALCAAPTLGQLRCRLAAAHAVRRGVRPDPEAPAQPWIVPALRAAAGAAEPLEALWRPAPDGGWSLVVDVPAGRSPRLDPETLRGPDGRPGRPAEVAWTPAEGEAWTAPWPDETVLHPYFRVEGEAFHEGPGRLAFTWPDAPAPAESATLSARTYCGLDLEIAARRELEPAPAPVPAAETVLEDRDRPPLLSPALLEIYPNPARDHAALRYRIPGSLEEAFVWEDAPPADLDLSAPVPYSGGQPHVTLTIYTVAGHEIANIFAGSCVIGEYSDTWDGLDATGRPVAAGTYFCKLQIDKWSVTKRVALLR